MPKLTLREHHDCIWLHVDNASGIRAAVNLGRRDPDSNIQRALTAACSATPYIHAVPELTDAQSKHALSAAGVEVAALKGQVETLQREIKQQWADFEKLLDCAFDGREFKAYSSCLDQKLKRVASIRGNEESHRRYAHMMQEQRSKIAEYCSLLEQQIEALKPRSSASIDHGARENEPDSENLKST